jgi:uncharacterized protein (DUF983 family)
MMNHIEGERVRTVCARCGEGFIYIKKTKPKTYCDLCKRLEHLDNCRVASKVSYETKVKPRRQALQRR